MNAENKAKTLTDQANKMRAKATKAQAAQSMLKRAERLMEGVEGERRGRPGRPDQVPRARRRAARPRSPPRELSKSYGSLEVFTDVDLADRQGQPGRHPRPQRRRQDHAAADPRRRRRSPTPARSQPGHGLKLGYYAQEHETLDTSRTVLREHAARRAAADRHRGAQRARARSCSPATTRTSRPRCSPAARRPGSRWRSWWSPAPTCCCSTSPPTTSTRPPARRCSAAIRSYQGAIVLVTHDEGAVARARARPGADPARRRRGPLERRLRRPGLAGLTPDLIGRLTQRLPSRARCAAGRAVDQDVLDAGGLRFEVNGLVATITLDRPDDQQLPDAARCGTPCAIIGALAERGRPRRRGHAARATRSPPGSTGGCSTPDGRRRRGSACCSCWTCPTRRWPRASRLPAGLHLAARPAVRLDRRGARRRDRRRLPAGARLRPAGGRRRRPVLA